LARLAICFVVVAALTAAAWSRIELRSVSVVQLAAVCALGTVPALVAVLVQRRGLRTWPARLAVGGLTLLTTFCAFAYAFGVPLTEMRPGPQHDFFGPALGGFRDGFLDFYETRLPFDRVDFPAMHGVVLVAVFGFVAVTGLLVALRRPVLAGFVLLLGTGWPATLLPSNRPLAGGALVLGGILTILFFARADGRALRGLPQAIVVALVLIGIAVGASTSSAVAKQAFLHWQTWDPYNRPDKPVSVTYVWDSNYSGFSFPRKKTVVLRVHVEGPERPLYWRATVLDEYTPTGSWREALSFGPNRPAKELVDELHDPLLPLAAQDPKSWVRQDVQVEALSDNHLIASAQPVKWIPGTSQFVREAQGGIVQLARALHHGQQYTAWSYVPSLRPQQLAAAPDIYPAGVAADLDLMPLVKLPGWGTPNRDAIMRGLFTSLNSTLGDLGPYEQLYREARRVVGDARSPYVAAVLLEAWFRESGAFHYDQHPPPSATFLPPLVDFVLHSRRGYCQHYAGAMALMLRLLGVPARVAAGFVSGSYDAAHHEWTVTDHDAHAWVEAFFPGFGWVPFDPTPGRGRLDAPYSTAGIDTDRPGLRALASQLTTGAGVTALDRTTRREPSTRRGAGPGGPGHPFGRNVSGGGGAGAVARGGRSLFRFLLLVAAGAIALLMVIKEGRRRLRFVSHDPRELAGACRRDMMGFLADQGIDAPPSATPAELGRQLERHFLVDAKPFSRELAAARFGPLGEARDAVRRARRELRALHKQMRSQLGFFRRLRGLVSLRSLTV